MTHAESSLCQSLISVSITDEPVGAEGGYKASDPPDEEIPSLPEFRHSFTKHSLFCANLKMKFSILAVSLLSYDSLYHSRNS
jgi:hypothetical protein